MFEELPRFLLDPPEDRPIAFDWNQSEIYPGDEVYTIMEETGKVVLVLKEDLENYIENQFGEAEVMQ
ncbi:hypothetical protein LHA31_02705 [Carnobacterium viridans]|uniref:hypothetical protein n=1 Tax=Carnobacterium viridans TaxID=174587 RepID=UPI000B7FDF02|nr:hypothetical protein [Carnobacterium viridans]UDE95705.1 hypothetical protein LHA31_02705 [Carnobacterium viridans]